MPLKYAGNTYPLPGETGQRSATTGELAVIEDHFRVSDALHLIGMLASSGNEDGEAGKARPAPIYEPGYSRPRAICALAWLAIHRIDTATTIAEVADVELSAFEFTEAEEAADPTPPGDEPNPASVD